MDRQSATRSLADALQSTSVSGNSSSNLDIASKGSLSGLSTTAVFDGQQSDSKVAIDIEVDLGCSLRRWLEQDPKDEPFTLIRRIY